MEKILEAWNFKTLQEFKNIILHIKSKGKTVEDVLDYVTNYNVNKPDDEKPFIAKPIRVCPQCNGKLKVFSLNAKELTEHPGMMSKWECCKTCTTKPCGYVEYVKETVEEIIEGNK